jgi:hypothetical protein
MTAEVALDAIGMGVEQLFFEANTEISSVAFGKRKILHQPTFLLPVEKCIDKS